MSITKLLKSNLYYLLKEITLRDINEKYKGSFLGIFWSILTPIGMLLVFSFVFGEIFKAKWPGNDQLDTVDFSINLFIGLSIFWFFADVLGKASGIFTSVPNYVKKVIFPLYILPITLLLSSIFHLFIHVIIIIIALILSGKGLSFNYLYFIIILFVSIPMLLGIGFLLGSLGVYIRDIGAIINIFVNMLMFLSPVFYPLSAIPQKMQWIFHLNPLTFLIEQSREIFLYDSSLNIKPLLIYFSCSICVLIVGYIVFSKTKKGFADVI